MALEMKMILITCAAFLKLLLLKHHSILLKPFNSFNTLLYSHHSLLNSNDYLNIIPHFSCSFFIIHHLQFFYYHSPLIFQQ